MFHLRSLGLLLAAALLTGCGGGSSGTPSIPGPGPAPTPTPTPQTARPNAAGIQAGFSGSIIENDVNNIISTSPVTTTTTSMVTDNVVTGLDSQGNVTYTSAENDATQLRTVTTNTVATVAFQPQSGGSVNVRALKTVATDSNGVTYETDYGSNNGLLTVLPEAAGSFSNDAKASYKETDPGQNVVGAAPQSVTTQRDVNADGSYSQTTQTFDYKLAPATNTAQEAPDFSGTLALNNIPGTRKYTFSAPAGNAISYVYYNGASKRNTPSTVPNWIPSSLTTPSVETDTIAPNSAFDPSCKASAKFGTTGTKVTQTVTTADGVLGTLETRTTTSYDVLGAGTVCATVADTIQTFYDFSEQEGPAPRLFPSRSATVPAETITIAETLSLQSINGPGISSGQRSTSAAATGLIVPRALLSAHVEHLVHQRALKRLAALRHLGGSSK